MVIICAATLVTIYLKYKRHHQYNYVIALIEYRKCNTIKMDTEEAQDSELQKNS